MDLKLWEYIFEMFNYKIRQKKSIFSKLQTLTPPLRQRFEIRCGEFPPEVNLGKFQRPVFVWWWCDSSWIILSTFARRVNVFDPPDTIDK